MRHPVAQSIRHRYRRFRQRHTPTHDRTAATVHNHRYFRRKQIPHRMPDFCFKAVAVAHPDIVRFQRRPISVNVRQQSLISRPSAPAALLHMIRQPLHHRLNLVIARHLLDFSLLQIPLRQFLCRRHHRRLVRPLIKHQKVRQPVNRQQRRL